MKKTIVVLTGAGISAESGIKTFRDADGLWEGHDVMEVASPEGWQRNRDLVLDFYNQRRRQLKTVVPNSAHLDLVKLEAQYETYIVTQNVDNLHERAGSKNILHLHGELVKSRSTIDEKLVYDCPDDIEVGDKCEKGSQLRPHIVWFGEMVPLLESAAALCSKADIIVIVGTSMQVYPAASLVGYAPTTAEIYYIDPKPSISHELSLRKQLQVIQATATVGMKQLLKKLLI